MFDKKEIMFGVFALVIGVFLAYACRLEAKQVDRKKVILKKWDTQLVYDTTNACYQGTLKWIVLTNPSLYGIPPGFESQRQMLLHCFCVMDRIQDKVSIQEYQKKVFEEMWVGNLFMTTAVECVKEEQTLPSFFKKIPDNETKGDHDIQSVLPKQVVPKKDKPKDSQDEPPGQKPEESENGLPETIFQG